MATRPRNSTAVIVGIVVGLGLLIFAPLVTILLVLQPAQQASQCGAGVGGGPSPIGQNNLTKLYIGAANTYGLGPDGYAYLGAINNVETTFGTNLAVSSAGAVGWMQFEPSTWAEYAVTPSGTPAPHDASGWNDPGDAIYTAAKYLHADGAPGDWHSAIFDYNHSDAYVAQVSGLAQGYLGATGLQKLASDIKSAYGSGTVPGGGTAPGDADNAVGGTGNTGAGCASPVTGPVTPGAVATIDPKTGIASIPANAPPAVQQMLAAGNRIISFPYVYGGGHGDTTASLGNPPNPSGGGYDCSSSTSYDLAGGGLLQSVLGGSVETSGALEDEGDPGPGQWVTWWANSGHVFIEIAGIVMNTAWYAPVEPTSPGSGPRWQPASTIPQQIAGDQYGGFVERHPPGL